MTADREYDDKQSDTDPRGSSEFSPPFSTALLEGSMGACRACATGMFDVNREIGAFVAKRVQCDLDAAQAFARCRSVDEVAKIQQEWSQSALAAYSEEWIKLAELITRTAARSAKTLPEQPPEGVEKRRAA